MNDSARPATRETARWHRRALLVLRVVVSLHAAVVFAQAVTAGLWLSGTPEAVLAHSRGARLVVLLGLAQLITATVLARRGGGPAWTAFSSLGILSVEIVQVVSGVWRGFSLHVPLGVLIFAGVMRLLAWVWMTRPGDAAGPRAPDGAVTAPRGAVS